MPIGAVVCPVCNRYTKWWRNLLRIDHIGLLLTFIIILLAYLQFLVARDELTKASEALQRAQTIEQIVEDVQSQVDTLETEMTKAQKNVEELFVFRQAAEEGVAEIAKTLEQVRSLQDQSDIPSKITRPSLKYLESKFTRTEEGLRGIILFELANGFQLSDVEFKVTMLPGSKGVIESISPSMPVSLMISTLIDTDGKQAILSYTVVGSGKPGIIIVLTEPSILSIEGSPGLKAFIVSAH